MSSVYGIGPAEPAEIGVCAECPQESCPFAGSPEGKPKISITAEIIKQVIQSDGQNTLAYVEFPAQENCSNDVCGDGFWPVSVENPEAFQWLIRNVDHDKVIFDEPGSEGDIPNLLARRAQKSI